MNDLEYSNLILRLGYVSDALKPMKWASGFRQGPSMSETVQKAMTALGVGKAPAYYRTMTREELLSAAQLDAATPLERALLAMLRGEDELLEEVSEIEEAKSRDSKAQHTEEISTLVRKLRGILDDLEDLV